MEGAGLLHAAWPLHLTRSWEDVCDSPMAKEMTPASSRVTCTSTRRCVLPKLFSTMRGVSCSCSPLWLQQIPSTASRVSTQKAAFSPSITSSFRGSLFTITPRRGDV